MPSEGNYKTVQTTDKIPLLSNRSKDNALLDNITMCDRVVRLVGSLSALASCRKWIFHIKETMERYMKQTISHWIPAVFCTFISLIAISGSVASDAGWWRPVFFSFLPMCFVFVGFVTFQMQCKIRELQKHLAEMQGK